MSSYAVTARNFSTSSENRIHSDDIARKFGFKGALVPGVAVYGHLTYLLAERFGAEWLEHSVDNLRLLKPAYHDDRLSFELIEDNGQHEVRCSNAGGELLATLSSTLPERLPAAEPESIFDGNLKLPERVEICWDNVEPGQPFGPWEVVITEELNQRYTSEVADPLPFYDTYAHPHLLLSLANTALTKEYVMPTWIHVGSETRHRAALKVGDTVTLRTVPLEKWQKKGHEFISLYVSLWRGDELTTDTRHTAIFKVAA